LFTKVSSFYQTGRHKKE